MLHVYDTGSEDGVYVFDQNRQTTVSKSDTLTVVKNQDRQQGRDDSGCGRQDQLKWSVMRSRHGWQGISDDFYDLIPENHRYWIDGQKDYLDEIRKNYKLKHGM